MAFDGYVTVRYAADADTPADLLTHVGTKIMVPAAEPIPTTYTNPGPGGFAGYGRMGNDGVQEWVLAGVQDELLRFVNRIPPEGSWADTEARRVWRRTADDWRKGINSTGEIKPLLAALYPAVAADLRARGWTPPAAR
jgi:hypothetical protein